MKQHRPNLALSPQLQQYITVMLIMVSFVVGAFVRKAVGQKPTSSHLAAMESQAKSFVISDAFSESGTELDSDKEWALQALLTQHDLNAEIEVAPQSDGLIEGALARSVHVRHALARSGVPSEAVRVIARGGNSSNDIDVRLVQVEAHDRRE